MTCECAGLHEGPAVTACQECGTRCCRSCAVEIAAGVYCRWCAAHLAASAA
jgi:hypothetical protein